MLKRVIKRIVENKHNSQLTVTIPRGFGYKGGDYVEVFPVPEQEVEKLREAKKRE